MQREPTDQSLPLVAYLEQKRMSVQHTLVGSQQAKNWQGTGRAVMDRISQDSCFPEGSRHLSTLGSWNYSCIMSQRAS